MDQETFARHVEDALAHLFDHFYLQFHPLSGVLASDAAPALRGRALSRVLVDAIERLKPGPDVPANSLAWRKYHYIALRYLQGVPPDQLSRQLGVSDRQGRRDHRQALDALCTLLWDTYCASPSRVVADAQVRATPGSSGPLPQADDSVAAGVEEELLHLGRVAPHSACSLADVVDGALATTGPLVQKNRCQVVADVPRTLSPVAMNPLILREIVIGLITQVVDLARESEVRISASEGETRTILTIASSARLPKEDAAALATMRRLAEMQGAQLSASDDGTGTLRLVLDLPMTERATVLVIDDNPDVVLLFRRYLGQTYRLIQATTADEALALATEQHPSLITLDVMMPGLDGWQILERLRSNDVTKAIPVVVCSILPEPSLALALGAVAYLPKPINPLALRSTLDRYLGLPR